MKPHWHRSAALLVVVVVVAAACGSDEPAPTNSPSEDVFAGDRVDDASPLDGSWVLAAATVDGTPVVLDEEYRVTMIIRGSQIGGRAACNGYGGAVSIDGTSVSVSNLAQNEMACEPSVMKIESVFLTGLLRVTAGIRSGDEVSLTGEGVEFVFTLLPRVSTSELIDVTWVLDSIIQGDTVSSTVAEAQPATLRLDADGTFTGGTGCRDLSGEYVVSGDVVQLTSFGAEGECPVAVERQDGQVITVLEGGFTTQIEGDRLTVSTAGGEGLGYTRQP